MSIAAVPSYLGKDFSNASPGLRFGMFLPLWSEAFALLKTEKTAALKQAVKLSAHDQKAMQALAARQTHVAQACPDLLTLDALATAPFTTGLGNEHPLENGFAFLNPYGLPYLPGSGVKGVLRQAARELASGEWGDAQGWSEQAILALFGNDPATEPQLRGALSFWDAIPQIRGDSLAVDVMTPHQSHYYQQKVDQKAGASDSPHDSGQPNPINFLTVPPGSAFCFHAQCDVALLRRRAPHLADNLRWQAVLTAAFEHAFEWLGFGAKTAVGYGAMQVDERKSRQRDEARQAANEVARLAEMTVARQHIEAFERELRTKHEQFAAFKENPNGNFHAKARALAKAAHEATDWSAEEKRAAAQAIEDWLPKLVRVDIKDERKKLKLGALKGP